MTPSLPNQTSQVRDIELIAAFSLLFSRARRFYQQNAETAGSGNLRRHFAALAELHQQTLYLLPKPSQSQVASDGLEALYELSLWYDNKRSQTSLATIQQQLVKQLQLQKAVIRHFDLQQYQKTLLHFTASLQIATDQLASIQTG
jgi:hypothetical protein